MNIKNWLALVIVGIFATIVAQTETLAQVGNGSGVRIKIVGSVTSGGTTMNSSDATFTSANNGSGQVVVTDNTHVKITVRSTSPQPAAAPAVAAPVITNVVNITNVINIQVPPPVVVKRPSFWHRLWFGCGVTVSTSSYNVDSGGYYYPPYIQYNSTCTELDNYRYTQGLYGGGYQNPNYGHYGGGGYGNYGGGYQYSHPSPSGHWGGGLYQYEFHQGGRHW